MSEHFQEEYGAPRLSEGFVRFKGFHSRGAVPQEDDFISAAAHCEGSVVSHQYAGVGVEAQIEEEEYALLFAPAVEFFACGDDGFFAFDLYEGMHCESGAGFGEFFFARFYGARIVFIYSRFAAKFDWGPVVFGFGRCFPLFDQVYPGWMRFSQSRCRGVNDGHFRFSTGVQEGDYFVAYDFFGSSCGVFQVVVRPDIDEYQCCLREWDFPVEVGIARVLFDPDDAFVNVPAVVTGGDGYFVHPSSLRSK